MIDPKHITTMPQFIPQTSIAPTTKHLLAKAEMEAETATKKLYAAEDAHKKKQKQNKVTELGDTVDSLNTQVAEAHAAKVTAKAAMDAIPDVEDKTAHIDSHSKADLHYKTLKDEHAAKKTELAAAEKDIKGGRRRRRRRTRKTRRKKRKSKHHRRRKRHTKKRKRSRRKRRSRRR